MDDIKKIKFTSSEQFLLGERVKVIGGARQLNNIGYIYHALNARSEQTIHGGDSVYVNFPNYGSDCIVCSNLDLDILDEQTYSQVKFERMNGWVLYKAYQVQESEILKAQFKVKFKQITDLFEEVFPEYYDIQSENGKMIIIVHFPELNLTNTDRSKHYIKDLYIKFTFKETGAVENMWGIRGSITKGEHDFHYGHSHLSYGASAHSAGTEFTWNNFCLGESEFAVVYREIVRNFNINKFRRFIYQLPTYLGWESLEGGPHRRIRDIKTNSMQHPTALGEESKGEIESIYKELIKNISEFPVTTISGNNVRLNINSNDVESLLAPYAGKFTCNKVGEEYWMKANMSQEGNWVESRNKEWVNITLFKFKNQNVCPKAYLSVDESVAMSVPFPDLTAKITNKLKQNLNQYVIYK